MRQLKYEGGIYKSECVGPKPFVPSNLKIHRAGLINEGENHSEFRIVGGVGQF